MYIASISEIKKELKEKSREELTEYCLRIAKYKKDNKELLNYLLFEAYNEESFKEVLKNEMELEFQSINTDSIYFAKKNIRRILRYITRQIRYSGLKQTEVELLISFCLYFRTLPLPFSQSKVLMNMYERQLKNIQKALVTLEEDLRFDYQSEMEDISKPLF